MPRSSDRTSAADVPGVAHAAEERFLEVATAAGVTVDGKVDQQLLAERCYEELRTKRVVNVDADSDDRRDPATSSHKAELAETIFSTMPTGPQGQLSAVEDRVRQKCLNAVWDVTQTSERGLVQRLLEADGLILVRGPVVRESTTISTGLFVSANEQVILADLLEPHLAKLRSAIEAIQQDYEMAVAVVPNVERSLRAAIDKAMADARTTLCG